MLGLRKLLSIILLVNSIISCTAYQTRGCTTMLSPIERMSTRRKRSLLLPKKGSIKLTIGLGKALISSSPKGLSQSWEISNYYAGPSTLKDWLNSVPQKSIAKPSVSNGTTTMKKDNFQINTKKYQNLFNPDYTRWNAMAESYPTVTFDQKHQQFYKPLSTKKTRQTGTRHTVVKRSYMKSKKTNTFKRESSLYDIITNFFGTDLQCTLVSSLCRSMEFLLPQGYSMIHDIVRLMYLTPVPGPTLGDEPRNICDSATHCDLKYESERSFNFLDWILNPVKVI